MNTDMILEIGSSSSDATFVIGERLGKLCQGGEVLVLSSDLGGGKTTLAKGIAKGLGSEDVVSSPTFTVNQVYKARDDIKIHHFDFYRLSEPGVVGFELAEVINDSKIVTIVEWGDVVEEVLPAKRIIISLARVATGEDDRKITVKIPNSLKYIKEAFV